MRPLNERAHSIFDLTASRFFLRKLFESGSDRFLVSFCHLRRSLGEHLHEPIDFLGSVGTSRVSTLIFVARAGPHRIHNEFATRIQDSDERHPLLIATDKLENVLRSRVFEVSFVGLFVGIEPNLNEISVDGFLHWFRTQGTLEFVAPASPRGIEHDEDGFAFPFCLRFGGRHHRLSGRFWLLRERNACQQQNGNREDSFSHVLIIARNPAICTQNGSMFVSSLVAVVALQQAQMSRAGNTFVLVYHDMVPKRTKSTLWFDCTPSELESQLDWLSKRGAKFTSLADLRAALVRGVALPKHPVAITFADNYSGFKTHAWPILKKRKIPVTMFVHTGFVGNQKGRPKMSWDDLADLARDPLFMAASQTVSHPADLRTLSASLLQKEFADSRSALLSHGHRRGADFIAYPNGKFDARVAKEAAAAGYQMGFSESQTPVRESPDPMRISRYVHTKWKEAWQEANR